MCKRGERGRLVYCSSNRRPLCLICPRERDGGLQSWAVLNDVLQLVTKGDELSASVEVYLVRNLLAFSEYKRGTRGLSLRTLATRRARRAPSACCRPPARPRLTRPPARHLGERPVRTQHADRTPLPLYSSCCCYYQHLLSHGTEPTRSPPARQLPTAATRALQTVPPTKKTESLRPPPSHPSRAAAPRTHTQKLHFFWCVQSTYNFL